MPDFAANLTMLFTELHPKDLNLARKRARRLQLSLPSTAMCQELFSACAAREGAGRGPFSNGQGARVAGESSDRAGAPGASGRLRFVPRDGSLENRREFGKSEDTAPAARANTKWE